ncbi:MAG: TlpA family protein disulfide reductase [Chloroflexota bacterium]|nr:TlpA family protein disulfide reductase [Chloroflexota bacterium]
MRLPVVLGMLSALIVGIVLIFVLVSALSQQPVSVPSRPPPTPTPAGITLATPTGSVSPATSPSPTPTASPTRPSEGTQVGQHAPRLVLPRLGGGQIDTAASAGTPLWINFMATYCPECRDELPMMNRMQFQLADQLEMVIVDVGENEETVAAFMVSLGVDLPVALDLDRAAQRQWGATVLPIHFFVDEDGIIAEVVIGGAPRDVFVEAVQTVVPDAVVPSP